MKKLSIEEVIVKTRKYFDGYFKENHLGEAGEKTVQLIACFSNKSETNYMLFGAITPRGRDHQMFEVRFFSDTGKMSFFIYSKSKTEIIAV